MSVRRRVTFKSSRYVRERSQYPITTNIRSVHWAARKIRGGAKKELEPKSSQYSIDRIAKVREHMTRAGVRLMPNLPVESLVLLLQPRRLSVAFTRMSSALAVKTEKKQAHRKHQTSKHANIAPIACTSLLIMQDAIMCGVTNEIDSMAVSAIVCVCGQERVLASDNALCADVPISSVRDTIKWGAATQQAHIASITESSFATR